MGSQSSYDILNEGPYFPTHLNKEERGKAKRGAEPGAVGGPLIVL